MLIPQQLPQELKSKLRRIKLLVLDVDGTLTDGGIFVGHDGNEFKRFDSQDGQGILLLQSEWKVEVVFLSGRKSEPVEIRARELGVTAIQGHRKKESALLEIIADRSLTKESVAIMGDDLSDLEIVQFAAISFAPANAIQALKQKVDYVTERSGGYGAVREVCDCIVSAKATIL